jgi:isopenicillin N synthase-like dioxygenase
MPSRHWQGWQLKVSISLPRPSRRWWTAVHYDLNFLTIHGKSRFPGLYIWLRNGRRVPVKVPTGHLIVQAGKQLEYLTGGYCQAGFHEVVVSEGTAKTIATRKAEGKSLWRVSSTLFGHIASDQVLRPLGKYADMPGAEAYPPVDCGQQVQDELNAIALGAGFGVKRTPEAAVAEAPAAKKAAADSAVAEESK